MHYDDKSETLRIVYVSGNVYDYLSVPASEFRKMKSATSKGTYLNKHIKKLYPYKKIK